MMGRKSVMKTAQDEAYYEKFNFSEAPKIATQPPGPKAKALLNRQRKVDSNALVYPFQIPLAPEKGLGATVMDADGNYYIDFSGGVGVLNVGHSNPEVVEAIKSQSEKLTHALDFPGAPRVMLSEKLVEIAPGDLKDRSKVFLCGPTGADAVEAAVKLGKYHSQKPGVIAFEGGWHGVTGSGLAATGKKSAKDRFLPLMPEVYHVPYAYCYRCVFGLKYPSCDLQCAKYLEHVIRDPDSGATSPGSVLIEPIQGEGGIVVPPSEYLQEVRRICTKYGLILIIDEIQTGFARTGRMFCCENWGVTPDIMCVSKTMGGGLPLAALIIKEEVDTWPSGAHVGTFRGNLLSCAAGLASIDFIEKNELSSRADQLGQKALDRLKEMAKKSRFMGDVRGKGLYVGVEFVKDKETREPAPEILKQAQEHCFQRGVILWKGGRWNNVARFMPALVITEGLLDQGIEIFEEVLRSIESK
jgi:diaminobutyrate-2-oxoglutarate transaminase